jgi:hypothetical protein
MAAERMGHISKAVLMMLIFSPYSETKFAIENVTFLFSKPSNVMIYG